MLMLMAHELLYFDGTRNFPVILITPAKLSCNQQFNSFVAQFLLR